MISIEVFEMNHFFQILEERFYLKEVELQDLCNYFQEYSPRVTLAEVTEGYIQDAETIKMYIRNIYMLFKKTSYSFILDLYFFFSFLLARADFA